MLGKFDSYRDSALHYLCTSDWANESFGDVSTYGKYVWRISNTREDTQEANTELNSVMESWEESEEVKLSPELRNSLVGHFLVIELDNGLVTVIDCGTELGLISVFNVIQGQWEEFNAQEEEED